MKHKLQTTALAWLSALATTAPAQANSGLQSPPYGLFLFAALILAAGLGGIFLAKSRIVKIFSAGILLLLIAYGALTYFAISRQPPPPWDSPSFLARKNLESLRSTLASYAADSETNRYPVGDLDYGQIRELLPQAELPERAEDAGWEAITFSYTSPEGTTYIISVRSVGRDGGTIVATPDGVSPNRAGGTAVPLPHEPEDTPTPPVLRENISVPEEVAERWEAVVLEIIDRETGQASLQTIVIGETEPLGNTGLTAEIGAFLPSFQWAGGLFTSSSAEPDNPAAVVSIFDPSGLELFRGLLFSKYPATHPFEHPRFAVTLKGFLERE